MDLKANKQDKVFRPESVYTLNADEINQITAELMSVIEGADIVPSSGDREQLKSAVCQYIARHNINGQSHSDIRQALENIQLLQFVETLPAEGNTKYVYAVPQDERTIDGQLIVVLFIWTGAEWAAVGSITTSVDLSEYLKKTEAAETYLPKSGGTISGGSTKQRPLIIESSTYGTELEIRNTKAANTPGVRVANIEGSTYIYNTSTGSSDAIVLTMLGNFYKRTAGVLQKVLTEADKGIAGGVASLDANGKVPESQIPQSIFDKLTALQMELAALKANTKIEAGENIILEDISASSEEEKNQEIK